MSGFGRFCYTPKNKLADGYRPDDVLGYTNSLPEACLLSHTYGSPASPMVVLDLHTWIDNNPKVEHITHGSVHDVWGVQP